MNDFGGVLGFQLETIVAELRRQGELRCREIADEARRESGALVHESRRALCERVRRAVAEERSRRDHALREAEYRQHSAERSRLQARYRELLDRAWPELERRLEARWADRASRRGWCDMLIGDAARLLGKSGWDIEHPPGWEPGDTAWLQERLAGLGVPAAKLRTRPGMAAGLRICSGDSCLDGTVAGLLRRRAAIEARLLAAFGEADRAGGRGP